MKNNQNMKPIFKTAKNTSENSKVLINTFNNIPAFIATGGEIVFASDDFLEVHLKFNLTENTMNHHKSGFGGAIYSSLDPVYPLQLMSILGDKYVVWDLAATIDYLKPIFKDVYARFILSHEQIEVIKSDVKVRNKTVVNFSVAYEDLEGNIYAKATKTIYIADKEYFDKKNSNNT